MRKNFRNFSSRTGVEGLMFDPLPDRDFTRAAAYHLLSRAGFGGTPDDVSALHARGLSGAVDWLVAKAGPELALDWSDEDLVAKRIESRRLKQSGDLKAAEEIQREVRREEARRVDSMREAWVNRMIQSEHPLSEKLTLFWHGHFATSFEKVNDAWLMWRQNETLRAGGLGSFGDLTKAITRDGAMIRWLDLDRSTRRAPNENFARELMELFTLGEGNYTEDDIKEAARAFTGYRFRPEQRAFHLAAIQHDDGSKRIFDRSGNHSGDDVVDLILENRMCSRFLAGRLWEFFAGPEPDAALSVALGEALRQQNYEIRPFLERVFRSRIFYSTTVAHALIKSPIDWLVSACRALEVQAPPRQILTSWLRQLGQVPFAPPNVRGWEGGRSWISATTLIARGNYAAELVGAKTMRWPKGTASDFQPADPTPWVSALDPSDVNGVSRVLVVRLFGPQPPVSAYEIAAHSLREHGTDLAGLRQTLHRLMCLPEYQLA